MLANAWGALAMCQALLHVANMYVYVHLIFRTTPATFLKVILTRENTLVYKNPSYFNFPHSENTFF